MFSFFKLLSTSNYRLYLKPFVVQTKMCPQHQVVKVPNNCQIVILFTYSLSRQFLTTIKKRFLTATCVQTLKNFDFCKNLKKSVKILNKVSKKVLIRTETWVRALLQKNFKPYPVLCVFCVLVVRLFAVKNDLPVTSLFQEMDAAFVMKDHKYKPC